MSNMTSTCGHVMTLDFPTKFNNWERVDPVDLYTAPTNKIEANAKMRMNDVGIELFFRSEAM
ncbi:hypothetical protein ANCDUO_26978 [Ancylostoma duodenale]|uniref:DNA topoisomerase n=1 Tax=Ancylostoma duodenale TaxID=51022 RepID=A0A0C2BGZ6_9BILA|nr:hypothetical protein ANCDUO_26978 [Ancylostoma duodenale]